MFSEEYQVSCLDFLNFSLHLNLAVFWKILLPAHHFFEVIIIQVKRATTAFVPSTFLSRIIFILLFLSQAFRNEKNGVLTFARYF